MKLALKATGALGALGQAKRTHIALEGKDWDQ